MTVTHDAAQRAAIHERIVVASEYAGAVDMPAEHGRQAMDAYREAGDEAGRLRAATLMARDLIGFHLEDEAAATLQSAIEEAKPLGEVPRVRRRLRGARSGRDAGPAAYRGDRGRRSGAAHGRDRETRRPWSRRWSPRARR